MLAVFASQSLCFFTCGWSCTWGGLGEELRACAPPSPQSCPGPSAEMNKVGPGGAVVPFRAALNRQRECVLCMPSMWVLTSGLPSLCPAHLGDKRLLWWTHRLLPSQGVVCIFYFSAYSRQFLAPCRLLAVLGERRHLLVLVDLVKSPGFSLSRDSTGSQGLLGSPFLLWPTAILGQRPSCQSWGKVEML